MDRLKRESLYVIKADNLPRSTISHCRDDHVLQCIQCSLRNQECVYTTSKRRGRKPNVEKEFTVEESPAKRVKIEARSDSGVTIQQIPNTADVPVDLSLDPSTLSRDALITLVLRQREVVERQQAFIMKLQTQTNAQQQEVQSYGGMRSVPTL